MKSVKSDKSCEKIKYPCLMEGDSGDIYLMCSMGVGTRVHSDGQHVIGEHSTHLAGGVTKIYNGSICLEN